MYDHQAVRAAAYHAINRGVDGMVTDVSSEVRSAYNIRKKDIDPRIKKFKASDYYDLRGSVEISGGVNSYTNALPLLMFNAVGRRNNVLGGAIKMTKGKDGYYMKKMKRGVAADGVSHKVMKSGGRGFSKNAFILPGASGSYQVVRRTGTGRKAFKEMRVVTMASMVASRGHGVADRVMVKAHARFQQNFKSNLLYYMSRVKAGKNIGGVGWNTRTAAY